ncbi:exo-alpha-sialidase [Streptomyces sp. NPDC058534]|uniref:exo-alpha-sialidase n=1 Tax=Streptomyces sp. NPDC058534 TaxID=3346541 RepID=UPI003647BC17
MEKRISRRSVLRAAGVVAGIGLAPQAVMATRASAAPGGGAFKVLTPDIAPSRFFRIPFMLTTKNGTLIVGSDANHATTGDSADNIDAVVRIKPDSSRGTLADGWNDPQIVGPLEMRDFPGDSGYAQQSASVIDGVITQDTESGRVWLLIDAWAWNGGVFEHLNVLADNSVRGGRARVFPLGDGFAEVKGRAMLLLSTENVTGDADGLTGNINLNVDRSRFTLVADVDGPRAADGRVPVYELVGTPRPYTAEGVDDTNLALGPRSEYSLDRDFVVHRDGSPLTVPQAGTGAQVPMRVFYKGSVLQVFNTSHIVQAYSDDDGATWQTGRLVTHEFRAPDSRYTLLAPGRAIQMRGGGQAGRIVVPVYTQLSSGVEAVAVVSDDGGVTWKRGEPVPTSIGMHESAMIEAVPGVLRSFHRHADGSAGKVLTSESLDGGTTWSTPTSAFGDDDAGVSCQVSALSLRQRVTSAETGEELPGIVVATAIDRARKNGVAHVGAVHETPEGPARTRIEWVRQVEITDTGTLFAYSSLEQLPDDRTVLLYESSPTDSWADGLQAMYIQEIQVS